MGGLDREFSSLPVTVNELYAGSKSEEQPVLCAEVLRRLLTFCPAGLKLQEPRKARKGATLTVVLSACRVAEPRGA